jgi:hypothetical protein
MTIAENFRPAVRRATLTSAAIVGLATVGLLLTPGLVRGDDQPIVNEKFSDLAPAIAELRQEAGQDRREVVKRNMLLLPSESAVFWPLYDQYRADMHKVGDRRVSLITNFLAKRDNMSEDDAKDLNKEYFAIEKATLQVKEKCFAKMSKVLSARTVARFFQIDGKLDAITNMALASQIPLIH